MLWRCHIGAPERNEATAAAWSFLQPFLEPYQRCVFSVEQYIPDALLPRSDVQRPAIDPLSAKNVLLSPREMIRVLRAAELVAGPPVPEAERFLRPARRYAGGDWVQSPIPNLLFLPTITQISRFDRLKGFDRLIDGFAALVRFPTDTLRRMKIDTARALSELASVQLILAGPDPADTPDDPEAEDVLSGLSQQLSRLDRSTAQRIHLVRLPLVDPVQNALMVNALQRFATVIAQLSMREGFGLPVTEALWKGIPLVATNVGGITVQVRPNVDGTLLDNQESPQGIAQALLQSLVDRARAEAMAREGHNRVRRHFLILTRLAGWLEELDRLLAEPRLAAPEEHGLNIAGIASEPGAQQL
jgi:trehalose synthase